MSKTLDEYLFQNVNLKEHIVATYRVRAKDNDFACRLFNWDDAENYG